MRTAKNADGGRFSNVASFYNEPSNDLERTSDQHNLNLTIRTNKIVPEPCRKSYIAVEHDSGRDHSKERIGSSHPSSQKKQSTFLKSMSRSIDSRRISFAKFTENLTKITKNAMNEITDSVRQRDFKEEYRRGLIKALNFLEFGSNNNPLLKLLKTFFFFNIQIFVFVMNALSVVNLVLVMDYRLGDFTEEAEPVLKIVEWTLGVFFSLEVLIEIFFKYSGFSSALSVLLSPSSIIDILLALEIGYSTLLIEHFKPRRALFAVIGFMRSFKLIRLRRLIEFNLKELRKLIENNNILADLLLSTEEDEIKYSVMTSVVDICVGIFIEATALLTVNEILNYTAFTNPQNFTYITAAYYAIVSLTTIGYGDVTPIRWESRLFIVIMLLFNITVLSSFIANLTDRIRKLSRYVRNFSWKNHVVIIGDIPLSFLQFFIEEINENKLIQDRLHVKTRTRRVRIIVVGKDEPSKELDFMLLSFSNKEKNGDAMYLKANIMESIWFKQANLQYAKHLFAFAINMKDSEAVAFEKDKQLAFNIQNLTNTFPKLPITLTLTSEYEQNINKDSLWKNVQTVPFRLLNNYIMATSIENQGFNTWLVHLMTLREKKEPLLRNDQKDSLMKDYSENMRQEIYPIRLPNFFIGKTFIEAAKIIYYSSVEFLDYLLLKPESGQLTKSELSSLKQFSLQLIAIQIKSDDMTSNSSKILINPVNHIILKEEIGYVIALDQTRSQEILSMEKNSESYKRYMRNMNLITKENKLRSMDSGTQIISHILENLENSSNNWRIFEEKYRRNANNNKVEKSLDFFAEFEKKEALPSFFNLFQDQSPRGLFRNHLIIKGTLNEMSLIAHIIRFYSERPIVLFTDQKTNRGVWAKIKASYSNVFCVLGNAMLVKHVEQLDPKKAFKILILANSKDELIQDSSNVIFTRILAEFFETQNFLVELLDENNMRFLSTKPQITVNNELDYYYWPYFVRGSIHFSSLIMSILARTLYNKYWVVFLKNLAHPKDNDFRASQEQNAESSNIMTFEITKEIAKDVQIYGHLQYFLMSHDPPALAIALLKEKAFMSSSKRKKISDFNINEPGGKLKAMLANHFLKTMDDLYHYSYLMTNPSFMTGIDVGDKVLILCRFQKKIGLKISINKEIKFVPRIKVYLNKSSMDLDNLKKEEEKKRVLKFFRERKKIWKVNDRRMEYKTNVISMLRETNKMIRFTVENYRNMYQDEEDEN